MSPAPDPYDTDGGLAAIVALPPKAPRVPGRDVEAAAGTHGPAADTLAASDPEASRVPAGTRPRTERTAPRRKRPADATPAASEQATRGPDRPARNQTHVNIPLEAVDWIDQRVGPGRSATAVVLDAITAQQRHLRRLFPDTGSGGGLFPSRRSTAKVPSTRGRRLNFQVHFRPEELALIDDLVEKHHVAGRSEFIARILMAEAEPEALDAFLQTLRATTPAAGQRAG